MSMWLRPHIRSASRNSLHQIPWQTLVSIILSVLGIAFLFAALFFQAELRDVAKSAGALAEQQLGVYRESNLPEQHLVESRLPSDEDHLRDVKKVFEIARLSDVRVGQMDHEWMTPPERGLRLHLVTFRLKEPYPDFKRFLDGLSKAIPHAGIRDLRIERRNTETIEVDATIQLMLLYRSTGPSHAE